jgi:hypothetical protein
LVGFLEGVLIKRRSNIAWQTNRHPLRGLDSAELSQTGYLPLACVTAP